MPGCLQRDDTDRFGSAASDRSRQFVEVLAVVHLSVPTLAPLASQPVSALATRAIKSLSDRPKRSSLQTTIVSPLLAKAKAKASFNPGRSAFAPLILSAKLFSHPAACSASCCNARFWSSVETRSYPMSLGGFLRFCYCLKTRSCVRMMWV